MFSCVAFLLCIVTHVAWIGLDLFPFCYTHQAMQYEFNQKTEFKSQLLDVILRYLWRVAQ